MRHISCVQPYIGIQNIKETEIFVFGDVKKQDMDTVESLWTVCYEFNTL